MKHHGTASAQNTQSTTGRRFLPRATSVLIAASLVAVAGLSVPKAIAAGNDEPKRACSLATLKGRYLFANSGILLPPAFGVTQPTPAADAGFHLFNGDGTGTDIVTFSIGGQVVLENVEAPVTYTVNADCTGTVTVLNGPSFDLFIAPDGEQFARIPTAPPGNYGAVIDRRVARN